MIPVVLSYQDTGAPALTGTTGSLYNVLKWALPQLGWTIEFDDGSSKVAFKNSGVSGSGSFIRVNDSAANHASTEVKAEVSAFESMSDVDTGSGKIPTTGERYWPKSHTEDLTERDWFIFGTDSFFIFLGYNGGSADAEGFRLAFAGDIKSYLALDVAPFVLSGNSDPSASSSDFISSFENIGGGEPSGAAQLPEFLLKSSDGVATGVDAILVQALPSGFSLADNGKFGGMGTFPDPISQGINTSSVEVFENSTGVWARRGYLPGLMAPLSNLTRDNRSVHGLTERETLTGLSTPDGPHDFRYFWGVGTLGGRSWSGIQHAILIAETADWDLI